MRAVPLRDPPAARQVPPAQGSRCGDFAIVVAPVSKSRGRWAPFGPARCRGLPGV